MWWTKKPLADPDRLLKLEEGFEKLRRQMAGLELEWTDTLDRVKRLMGRIAKRAELVERHEEAEAGSELRDPTQALRTPGLSPSQSLIQQRILARRNRTPLREDNQ